MRFALIFGSSLLAFSLVACQQNPEKAEKKAEVAICENLAAVGDAIENVQAQTPTSTVGDALKAQKTLTTAITNLEKSEANLEKIRVRDLRDQLKAFNKDLEKVSSQKKLTIEQAAQAHQHDGAVRGNVAKLISGTLFCGHQPAGFTLL